jgi:hypothetical protein
MQSRGRSVNANKNETYSDSGRRETGNSFA